MTDKEKKVGFWEGLLIAGGVIGGAWLGVELFKLFSKKVYRCPYCNKTFETKYTEQCPHCHNKLRWEI